MVCLTSFLVVRARVRAERVRHYPSCNHHNPSRQQGEYRLYHKETGIIDTNTIVFIEFNINYETLLLLFTILI